MRFDHRTLSIFVLITLLSGLAGCGGGAVDVPDRAAFDQAVNDYLKARSMQLKIDEYRKFDLADDGATAKAVILLSYAGEGAAQAQVRFEFDFRKTDGKWQVTAHRRVQ